jgi:hypothetical protein
MATRSELALAGQASMRAALIATVERSVKIDHLIAETEKRKRSRARYRVKRAETRRNYLQRDISC